MWSIHAKFSIDRWSSDAVGYLLTFWIKLGTVSLELDRSWWLIPFIKVEPTCLKNVSTSHPHFFFKKGICLIHQVFVKFIFGICLIHQVWGKICSSTERPGRVRVSVAVIFQASCAGKSWGLQAGWEESWERGWLSWKMLEDMDFNDFSQFQSVSWWSLLKWSIFQLAT